MDNELCVQEKIRVNAEIVVDVLKRNNAPPEYGLPALHWLEQFIEERRGTWTEAEKSMLINNVGAFLGECLCKNYDGVWIQNEYGWGVSMADGLLVSFPFSNVRKFIYEGPEDSFASVFGSTAALIEYVKSRKQDKE